MIYNASGIVNFAQGASRDARRHGDFILLQTFAVPLVLAAAITAIVLVAAIGVVLSGSRCGRVWDRNATMFVMILATLAAQIVIERATQIAWAIVPRRFRNSPIFRPSRSV